MLKSSQMEEIYFKIRSKIIIGYIFLLFVLYKILSESQ